MSRLAYPLASFGTLSYARPKTDFLTLASFSVPQISALINRAVQLKCAVKAGLSSPSDSCRNKSLAIMFSKSSTRSRIAAETAFHYLGGGHPIFLNPEDVRFGINNESIRDAAQVISGMCDMMLVRCGPHKDLEQVAKYSRVPVINALSDTFHPTQILADMMTLHEHFNHGTFSTRAFHGLKACYIGDPNNVTNSLALTLPRFGASLTIATPHAFKFSLDSIMSFVTNEKDQEIICENVHHIHCDPYTPSSTDPHPNRLYEAVRDANVIITDTWVSMGYEHEREKRLREFQGFHLTHHLMKRGGAASDWVFLHCLPRKQDECSDAVFYDEKRSLVWEEAENRKYTMMAVFDLIMRRELE